MIYDTLANAHLYQGISDRLQKGLDFLIHSNFTREVGAHPEHTEHNKMVVPDDFRC